LAKPKFIKVQGYVLEEKEMEVTNGIEPKLAIILL